MGSRRMDNRRKENQRGRKNSFFSSLNRAYEWLISGDEVRRGNTETSEREDDGNATDQPGKVQPLTVKSVDFQVVKNTKAHHTEDYDITRSKNDNGDKQTPQLIVRRGETFDISLVLDRKYDPECDKVVLYLETGKKPCHGKGTLQVFSIDKGVSNRRMWGAEIDGVQEKSMTVKIMPAPDAPIGKWSLSIASSLKKTPENEPRIKNCYEHDCPIYLLFNAWCKLDQVYMEDESLREEYVLNPNGRIFTGTHKQISWRDWVFGQFEDVVLDCAMYLLEEFGLKDSAKGDPVMITRKISALINSNDDNGILMGNWSGDYDDGTSPSFWTGSVAILEQYYKDKEPVMYGQCWVFSGVVTTVCRAIGIPTRSVTNFSSAHDTDGGVTIDYYFRRDPKDDKVKPVDDLNKDSIWNFHVWNEAWMARPSLPPEMKGWQAFDATPQELSDGVYCAGPAPVKAIKEGLVNNSYDTTFIYAEVNADKVFYTIREDGTEIRRSRYPNKVGKHISTKCPDGSGDNQRLDITSEYKYAEGSSEERNAMMRAHLHAKMPDFYESENDDVKFELDAKDHYLVGNNFDVALKLKNTSRYGRTVRGSISINTVYYTGTLKQHVKTHEFCVELPPLKSDEVVCRVAMEEYLRYIVDQASFRIDAEASVDETDQEYTDNDAFRLRRPDLEVTAPPEMMLGDTCIVHIKLENPMPDPLTHCKWHIEGAALHKIDNIEYGDVEPYGKVEIDVPVKPKKPGKKMITASFDSKELKDVSGSCILDVVE